MRFHVLLAALLLAELLRAGFGYCQEQAAAEALFRSGKAAASRGDWQTACDRFQESERLEPAPGTLLNLARCREKLGQLASAWKRYGEVAQRLPKEDPRARYSLRKEKELEARVPRLILLPPEDGDVFSVRLGGVSVSAASFGVPLPVDPGAITVTVDAEGREPHQMEVALQEGERRQLQLVLGPKPSPDSTSPESSGQDEASTGQSAATDRSSAGPSPGGSEPSPGEPEPSPKKPEMNTQGMPPGAVGEEHRSGRSLAVGLMATGGVGILAGAVGGIWSATELATVNSHCIQTFCDSAGMNAARRGRAAVVMTATGLSVGVLGLSAGYLLLKGKRSDETSPSTISLGGGSLPGGAFMTLRGYF